MPAPVDLVDHCQCFRRSSRSFGGKRVFRFAIAGLVALEPVLETRHMAGLDAFQVVEVVDLRSVRVGQGNAQNLVVRFALVNEFQ